MNVEEIYMTLYGASRSVRAKYDVVRKWFTKCGIIDNGIINDELYQQFYERSGNKLPRVFAEKKIQYREAFELTLALEMPCSGQRFKCVDNCEHSIDGGAGKKPALCAILLAM